MEISGNLVGGVALVLFVVVIAANLIQALTSKRQTHELVENPEPVLTVDEIFESMYVHIDYLQSAYDTLREAPKSVKQERMFRSLKGEINQIFKKPKEQGE